MKDELRVIIAAFLILVLSVGTSYLVGYKSGKNDAERPVETKVDTIVTRDTIFIDSPVPVVETPVGFELVKVGTVKQLKARLAALESDADYWASNPDTVLISVPIEITQKQYKGEDYEAQVSGYHPRLDYIKVFPQTVTITTTQTYTKTEVPKWTVSPFAGVDIGYGSFAARAGIIYDRQLRGGLRLYLGGGSEVRNESVTNRHGLFAVGGVSYSFHK